MTSMVRARFRQKGHEELRAGSPQRDYVKRWRRLLCIASYLDVGSNSRRAALITILLFSLLCPLPVEWAKAQQAAAPVLRSDEPGLSEQMIMIQLRHTKLWFAGKLGNWKLAAYQLDLLAKVLNDAAKRIPAGSSAEDTAKQIISLRSAIDVRNLSAFIDSYSELTNTCNACHRATGRDFISVQIPAASPFTDQDFADQVAEGRALVRTMCGVCHAVPDKPNVPLALRFSAPSFVELVRRPSSTESALRRLLTSEHRRVGPDLTMPNPRLNNNQIDALVAYFEALKLDQKKSP